MKYLNNKIVTVGETTLELTASNKYEGNIIFTSGDLYFEQTGEVEAKENDGEIVDEFFKEQTRINNLVGYLIIDNKAQIYSGQSVIDNDAIKYKNGKEPVELANGLAYKTPQETINDFRSKRDTLLDTIVDHYQKNLVWKNLSQSEQDDVEKYRLDLIATTDDLNNLTSLPEKPSWMKK